MLLLTVFKVVSNDFQTQVARNTPPTWPRSCVMQSPASQPSPKQGAEGSKGCSTAEYLITQEARQTRLAEPSVSLNLTSSRITRASARFIDLVNKATSRGPTRAADLTVTTANLQLLSRQRLAAPTRPSTLTCSTLSRSRAVLAKPRRVFASSDKMAFEPASGSVNPSSSFSVIPPFGPDKSRWTLTRMLEPWAAFGRGRAPHLAPTLDADDEPELFAAASATSQILQDPSVMEATLDSLSTLKNDLIGHLGRKEQLAKDLELMRTLVEAMDGMVLGLSVTLPRGKSEEQQGSSESKRIWLLRALAEVGVILASLATGSSAAAPSASSSVASSSSSAGDVAAGGPPASVLEALLIHGAPSSLAHAIELLPLLCGDKDTSKPTSASATFSRARSRCLGSLLRARRNVLLACTERTWGNPRGGQAVESVVVSSGYEEGGGAGVERATGGKGQKQLEPEALRRAAEKAIEDVFEVSLAAGAPVARLRSGERKTKTPLFAVVSSADSNPYSSSSSIRRLIQPRVYQSTRCWRR